MEPEPTPPPVSTQAVQRVPPLLSRIKTRLSGFTTAEKEQFEANFREKYQPAVQKWCKAYEGRVPFDAYDVTIDQFVERIGTQDRYREYIFVVNGITLGVRDSVASGIRVDYLNVPTQTRKMAMMPEGGTPPVVTSMPVTREQVADMLRADGGLDPNDKIDFIPSGLSGSLNGGAIVNVGPDPENGASLNYSLVFGPDGKLAYYLKGREPYRPGG